MPQDANNLIWIDLEMTGLNTQTDYIIEIATIVTNSNLDVIVEGPVFAIRQSDEVLNGMDEWNTRQHGNSGLVERVRKSKYSALDAERETLDFLRDYVPANKSPMCGNSICQDRRFLARHMPDLEAYFHYRNLDVSTIKELGRRWYPQVYNGFVKTPSHLAMDDIRDSIRELQYYRERIFIPPVAK